MRTILALVLIGGAAVIFDQTQLEGRYSKLVWDDTVQFSRPGIAYVNKTLGR